jgi:hypothetical protein
MDFKRREIFYCQVNVYWRNRETHKTKLWKQETLSIDTLWGIAFTGDSCKKHDGGYGNGAALSMGSL